MAGHHTEVEQEEHEHALEEPAEDRLDGDVSARARGRADPDTADEQHDALAGEDLPDRASPVTPASGRRVPAGQQQPDDDARNLEDGEQRRHVPLRRDPGGVQGRNGSCEGHQRGGPVVGGDGRPVDPVQPGQPAQRSEGDQRCDDPEQQRAQDGEREVPDIRAAQTYAALEPDGQQQVERQESVHLVGQLEVRAQQGGGDAEQEREDGR